LFIHLKRNIPIIYKFDIENQLRLYFYSQILIRSGGVITSDVASIPFTDIQSVKNIVIFSSGSFGQHLISSLQKLNYFNIISWLDDDHIESQIFGLEVNSVDHILEINFDLVIIASIDEQFTSKAINKFIKIGIPRNKISCFKLDIINLEKSINEIGFDLKEYKYKQQIYAS
jgi:hypothetical protein